MSFDFLGTFNASQLARLAAFLRDQKSDIGGRIAHLTYEKKRIGSLTMEFDGRGAPLRYVVSSPTDTYIGALVSTYEVLGGNVLYDLQVRTLGQAVYLERGTETRPATRMSNGEPVGSRGLADAPSSELVRKARSWVQGSLHYRREYLEKKIRRAIDYVDQLDAEPKLLANVASNATTKGSLDYTLAEIDRLIQDPNYRTIYNDKGADPHGKNVYAGFLPYSRKDTTLEGAEAGPSGRDYDGYREEGA